MLPLDPPLDEAVEVADASPPVEITMSKPNQQSKDKFIVGPPFVVSCSRQIPYSKGYSTLYTSCNFQLAFNFLL
jgi:hypothetical protein